MLKAVPGSWKCSLSSASASPAPVVGAQCCGPHQLKTQSPVTATGHLAQQCHRPWFWLSEAGVRLGSWLGCRTPSQMASLSARPGAGPGLMLPDGRAAWTGTTGTWLSSPGPEVTPQCQAARPVGPGGHSAAPAQVPGRGTEPEGSGRACGGRV